MRISDTMLQKLKHDYPEGTRVRLIRMDDPYSRLEPGEEGNVIGVDDIGTIHVKWDNGSTLGLAFLERTLGYHPCDIGILTCASESRRGTLSGGQFDWGGRLLKSSGGVQRFVRSGRKPDE